MAVFITSPHCIERSVTGRKLATVRRGTLAATATSSEPTLPGPPRPAGTLRLW